MSLPRRAAWLPLLVLALPFAGCGYYPRYVHNARSICSLTNRNEPIVVILGDTADCVDRLGELGWSGRELRLEAAREVDDRVLEAVARLRAEGRIRFDGFAVADASRCSSRVLCEVPGWASLRWAVLGKATFASDAAPRFAPGFNGLTIEDTVPPPGFWRHIADSDVESLSFTVNTETLLDEAMVRLKSRAGDIRYDFMPADAATVTRLQTVILKLRAAGESRRYGWVDERRYYNPL